MLEAVGHPVRRLVRVRIGPIELDRLALGSTRPLTRAEIAELRRATAISPAAPAARS
jgi:23S rRNA pseudouridine2605 synthase